MQATQLPQQKLSLKYFEIKSVYKKKNKSRILNGFLSRSIRPTEYNSAWISEIIDKFNKVR